MVKYFEQYYIYVLCWAETGIQVQLSNMLRVGLWPKYISGGLRVIAEHLFFMV